MSRRVPPSTAFFGTSESFHTQTDAEDPPNGDKGIPLIGDKLPIAVVATKFDLTDRWVPRPLKAKFPSQAPLFDRLFGGMSKFMQDLWEARIPVDEQARLKQMACYVLDAAPEIAFSAKYQQADLRELDRFLQQSTSSVFLNSPMSRSV
eukprot:GHVN01052812.1.p1 GENE.GHVN01052812.1~~GHVN01052812.1.p1  ORF type:complete len:149 (-),score=20.23 GHVN01052812.1:653-1099(-)